MLYSFSSLDALSGHCLSTNTHKLSRHVPMLCTLQLTTAQVHAWVCPCHHEQPIYSATDCSWPVRERCTHIYDQLKKHRLLLQDLRSDLLGASYLGIETKHAMILHLPATAAIPKHSTYVE